MSAGGKLNLRAHRLAGSDFTRLYKLGRRARGSHFTVVALENALGKQRMGLSVGKRHAKEAVDRNRARRVLREAFRLTRAELPNGIDLVLIPHPGGARLELAVARAELLALVPRALAKKARAEPEVP
jgi:ribonuclease P protein component